MVPEATTDDEETSIAHNSVDISFIRGRIGSAPESAGAQARRDTKLSCRVSCGRVYSGSYTSQLYSMLPSTSSRSGSEKYKIPNAVNKPPAKLDVVLGRTVVGPNSLAVNDKTARFAYVAGACIVVSSLEGRLNEGHLIGTARHPFTCLSFSSCGKYIATGESGHQPCIRIWEVKDEGGRLYGQQIKNFNLHSISIVAVRFVPGTSLLVSVGCQHDGQICAWDWRSGTKLGIGKVSAPVNAIALSSDGSVCVTVGSKHVKYWYLPASDSEQGGLQSRSAILADRRSSTFVDAVFLDSNRLLAITEDGCLVEFTNKKYVNTYQFDGNNCPLCLNLTANAVVLGCTNGIVQLYSREDLSPIEKLPRPAYIGMDPAVATSIDMVAHHPDGVGYPDARVVAASSAEIFIVVYADRSMFVYQKVENQWLKKRSSLAHVGSINVIMTLPSHLSHLPSGSFLTGGSDGTVRIWNLDGHRNEKSVVPITNFLYPSMKKVIFIENDVGALWESRQDLGMLPSERQESTTGIRCLGISPDGKHLVAGTKMGNLHIIDITNAEMKQIEVINAHDQDVICVEYSDPSSGAPYLLASGGRDRLVHLFRPGPQRYTHSHVIEDHQSSINSVKFVKTADHFYVYTCAADKVIVIWRLISFTEKSIEFFRENLISAPVSLNHLLISPSGNSLLTACHDRQLRSYSLRGKLLTTVKGTGGEADIHQGTLNKFCIDPSGSFAATICSDRQVYVVDARSGNCVAAIGGTGDAATDVSFSNDCRRLYVTSANGCIFVWRLSDSLVDRMLITKKSMDDMSPRTPSPDSLLGSGSEAVSDEPFLNLIYNIGTPHFGSSESLSNWKDESIVPIDFSAEKDKEKDISLVVRPAQIARRSNLFTATDPASGDISDSESQSDFISKRSTQIIQYQSSKSMVNLRDDGLGQGATANLQGIIANHLDRPPRRIRSGWANPPPPSDWESPPIHPNMSDKSPIVTLAGKEDCHMTPRTRLVRPLIRPSPQYVQMRSNGHAPSQSNVSQTLSVSVAPNSLGSNQFRRDTPDRVSLTKRFMQESQPRTVWTPQTMTPRRTTSNMQSIAPSGAVASAITRRQSEQFRVRFKTRQKNGASNDSAYRLQPQKTVDTSSVPSNKFRADDYANSALHLRSRSQSPNHILLNQTTTLGNMDFAKDLQRRRDSDMSYTAISSRITPASSRTNLRSDDMRKSTEALNKIAAMRSKLHQSSENLRKSSDNLKIENTTPSRTRSISNLRCTQLEPFGTFDADQQTRISTFSSLAQSRMLARSVGNISSSGGDIYAQDSPGIRLQNTIDMMKKTSISDLTQSDIYEDTTCSIGEKMRRRGAVQKKVERYHPRNRTTRNQTSEESDSNASDASPLNQSMNKKMMMGGTNRSVSSVEASPRIFGSLPGRRLYEQQRCSTLSSPRRTTNYLAQKMAGEDMVGPDLGSDESPRSSVNNAEWLTLLDEGAVCKQLVKHVQECLDQLQVNADKTAQARKLVEESSLTAEQKLIIENQIERATEKIIEKLDKGKRRNSAGDTNGNISNDYTPVRGPQIYTVLKENLSLHR